MKVQRTVNFCRKSRESEATSTPMAATRMRIGPVGTLLSFPRMAFLVFVLAFCLQPSAFAQTGATVTWAGGNSFLGWSQDTNWNPQIAPLNNPGTNFTVIVPDYTSLSYDSSTAGFIDALSFGTGSQLLVTNGQSLGVVGVAIIKGQIDARGAGSAFQAPANTIVLSGYPRFLARDGAQVGIGASSYSWGNYGGNATLLSAIGDGSLVDVHKVTVMQLSYGDSGSWTYAITAQSNGVVDLSGLGNLTGPGSDDVLELNVDTAGLIKLDNVRQITGRTRFNIGLPSFQIPQATLLDSATVNLSANAGFQLPQVASITSSAINISTGALFHASQASSIAGSSMGVGQQGLFHAPQLNSITGSSISVAPDGIFNAPQLNSITGSTIGVDPGGMFTAPQLRSMDNVPLTLAGNGAFLATNLTTYRNSDIPILPGRDFSGGLLTNIYASRIWVNGGMNYRVGALDYEMPPTDFGLLGYRWSPPEVVSSSLFSADGSGSLLDLSTMRSVRVHGITGSWYDYNYGWRYSVSGNYFISAANQGVIDLSGLDTIYGADPNNYGGDDWLAFKVQTSGDILLPNLRQVTQRTRFDIQVPRFEMRSLQAVDNTGFNLSDGTRLDLPSLQRFDNSWISFGFNSSFNAPQLVDFLNSDLNLVPGKIFSAPGITNINGSRISVANGATWICTAESYLAAGSALLSADGLGSLLDFSSMKTFAAGGSIAVNNSGTIDLSGLETITGSGLTLSVQNGGSLRLENLQQATGTTRIVLGDGERLDLTNLTRLADGVSVTFGTGSTFNAPRLVEVINSDLAVTGVGSFIAPPLTNIYASRLSVSGGRALHVAATSYEMPPTDFGFLGYRWSPPEVSSSLFSADGSGSLLDLSTMISVRVNGFSGNWYDYNYGWRYSVSGNYFITAANQGVIDLSGLNTIYGADPNSYGGDDWLSLSATLGGVINAGNLSVFQRAGFAASDPNSALEFGGLYLRSPATLSVGAGTRLRIRGDFIFENTDTNSIVTEFARFQMDGTTPQRLEVGGQDLGPTTPLYRRNFGYSQFIVGGTNQTSVVHLVDSLNNGGRGPSGEPEALYLYGLEGQGLRLLSGSRLVLGGLNCYAAVNGQTVNLKTLVNSSTNSVAFDGGFLGNMGGPRITGMTPSVAVTPPVSFVDVAFDMAINPATFSTEDVTIMGPSGPITPSEVTLVSNNTYRISFAPQTANGVYSVRVGPDIDELPGNFHGMDQNGNGLAGETTDAFSGTFQVDGVAPSVVRALALQYGTRVGITFSKPVSSSFATNPANYSVNGVPPTQAVLQTNGCQVALSVDALLGEAFSLAVNNLSDLLGNTTNADFNGFILPMTMSDIGSPAETGATLTFNGVDFDMISGGLDWGSPDYYWWNGSDAGQFAFENRAGDFEVQVQVTRLDQNVDYAYTGIMWRESIDPGSRRVIVALNSPSAGNAYWLYYRTSAYSGGSYINAGGVPPFPNAWLRLKRADSLFIAYIGSDGTNWTEYGRITTDFASSGVLGLTGDSRNNNSGVAMFAAFKNYGDITPAIIAQPQSQTVASGSNVVFGVTARGLPELGYQWFHNGLALTDATNALLTLWAVDTNSVGDYFAVVRNPFGMITSQVATLVVDGVGAGGFEGDVSPEPYGNNAVSVSDWVKVGRLVAGLDTPLNSSEFMRADCAPRTDFDDTLLLGDGRLTVADWTQAGRYAAGLDPLTPAGGPSAPIALGFAGLSYNAASFSAEWFDGPVLIGRSIWAGSAKAVPGQTVPIPVTLQAQGDENAIGFTLTFDPTQLAYRDAGLADGLSGVTLQVNARQTGQGRLGIVLGRSVGQTFAADAAVLVQVRFTVLGKGGTTAAVGFGDAPVLREVVNATADSLIVDYRSGGVRILQAGNLTGQLQSAGRPMQWTLSGQAGETYRVEVSSDLVHWSVLTNQTIGAGPVLVVDPAAPLSKQRFYRAVSP